MNDRVNATHPQPLLGGESGREWAVGYGKILIKEADDYERCTIERNCKRLE